MFGFINKQGILDIDVYHTQFTIINWRNNQ